MLDGLGPAIHQYARSLGYTLMLNALGFRYLYKAWTQDLYVLRDTTQVLRWFLVAVGVALQIPGLLYLWVGWWSASQIAPHIPRPH